MYIAELQSGVTFLVLTLIYTFSSVVILFLSHRSNKIAQQNIKELEAERIAENRPYVFFGFEIDRQFTFFLNLKNTGRTAAHNVKLRFHKDLIASKYRDRETKEEKTRMFSMLAIADPIPFITPGRVYKEFINSATNFWSLNDKHGQILATLEYSDDDGNLYKDDIDIDLTVYFQRVISSSVNNIETSIQDIERLTRSIY
ncbi:MAG: hypothetical protein K8S87_05735 [Planctomycetes bacterium]|nr:hypothetical protein [Planctomycetota bacterium]